MSNIDKNLLINKIEIPEAVKPIANYSPFIITNNLIFISGQIPISSGDIIYKGKLGAELDVEEGKKAAKLCILNTFGVLKLALNNNLSLIKRCIKITAFINSIDTFNKQPEVADGASNIISDLLNPEGNHSRSAVSVNSLPRNSAVEIDSVFEIKIEK